MCSVGAAPETWLRTSQITYVTMVPRGNETLHRKMLGEHLQ